MNTALWVIQIFLASVFLYSGVCKATLPIDKLVSLGQTGVEHIAMPYVRLIAAIEILGVVALILPWLLDIAPILTPVAATGFAIIMLLAAPIHYKRGEPKSVTFNSFVFLLCITTAYLRFKQV